MVNARILSFMTFHGARIKTSKCYNAMQRLSDGSTGKRVHHMTLGADRILFHYYTTDTGHTSERSIM